LADDDELALRRKGEFRRSQRSRPGAPAPAVVKHAHWLDAQERVEMFVPGRSPRDGQSVLHRFVR
jgi:hypothetical protein